MKAIVLAAGLGTRLRPITDYIPKPLVPVLNEPLLKIALYQMRHAGFTSFAVNAFHLPEKIKEFSYQQNSEGVDISVFLENERLLGTGGPLQAMASWIGGDSFLVYNGDIISEINFEALRYLHLSRTENLVTMAVRPGHSGQDRAVWVVSERDLSLRVVAISKQKPDGVLCKPYSFACAYASRRDLLSFIPENAAYDVIEAFNDALQKGHVIEAMVTDGFWADVGSPQSLWDTSCHIYSLPRLQQQKILGFNGQNGPSLIAAGASIEKPFLHDGLLVVGEGAVIQPRSQLKDCVVLPGSVVKADTMAEKVIFGPNGIQISVT